jgi:hypothetical protein
LVSGAASAFPAPIELCYCTAAKPATELGRSH